MQAALNIIWLAIQIAGLSPKPVTDYVSRLDFRVGALETRKQLHLIVRETGDDLGVSVDGALAAWSDDHQAVIDYRSPRGSYWSGPLCDGALVGFSSNPEAFINRYVFLPNGQLARPTSVASQFRQYGSQLDNSGGCVTGFGGPVYPAIIAGFVVPRFSPDLLDIQMR